MGLAPQRWGQYLSRSCLASVCGSSVHYVLCAAMFIVRGDQRLAYGRGESGLAAEEEKWAMRPGDEDRRESEAAGFGQKQGEQYSLQPRGKGRDRNRPFLTPPTDLLLVITIMAVKGGLEGIHFLYPGSVLLASLRCSSPETASSFLCFGCLAL